MPVIFPPVISGGGGGGGDYLPRNGSASMTGTLNMGYHGLDSVGMIRFQDVEINEGLGTLELAANGSDPVRIVGVDTPVNDDDATPKGFVTGAIATAVAAAVGDAIEEGY